MYHLAKTIRQIRAQQDPDFVCDKIEQFISENESNDELFPYLESLENACKAVRQSLSCYTDCSELRSLPMSNFQQQDQAERMILECENRLQSFSPVMTQVFEIAKDPHCQKYKQVCQYADYLFDTLETIVERCKNLCNLATEELEEERGN